MKEFYLTKEEVEFLFRWFYSTTNGVQVESYRPREDATENDKEIYKTLRELAKSCWG